MCRLLVLLTGMVLFTAIQAQEIDEVVLIVDDIAVTAHEYCRVALHQDTSRLVSEFLHRNWIAM